MDCHTIETILDKHIDTEVDFEQIAFLGVLGIDEISLRKGHKKICRSNNLSS